MSSQPTRPSKKGGNSTRANRPTRSMTPSVPDQSSSSTSTPLPSRGNKRKSSDDGQTNTRKNPRNQAVGSRQSQSSTLPVGPNIIMTENAPILDGYVPEENLTLRTRRGEELTLYSSQRRVGEILFRRSREMLNFDAEDPPTDINFLIIGPAQTEIRNQTARDLGIVLESTLRHQNKLIVQAVRTMVKYVKNSSAIFTPKPNLSEEAKEFLDKLEENPNGDNLHILFHDEAHWGIESDSNVNTFLQMVLKVLRKHEKKGIKPNFLFVQVSATPRVLLAARNEATVVDWEAPDSYRKIENLRFINDCGQGLLNQRKQTQRGEELVDQYTKVLTAWIDFLKNPHDSSKSIAFQDVCASYSITYKALKKSVMEKITLEDAQSFKHYSETGGRNKCLLIRMPSVEQARALQSAVRVAFGTWMVFECLLYEGSTDATLSERATGSTEKPLPLTEITTALEKIPSMIIVVDKMQMGSRIPHQTTIFDVRSRYVGSVEKEINGNQSTFIQDVGRMAGFKNPKARVLMSLIADSQLRKLGNGEYKDGEDDSEDDDEAVIFSNEFKFQAFHALMNKNGTLGKKFDENLYDGLSRYTILLNALPQIGKTGAILAFLQKLFLQAN